MNYYLARLLLAIHPNRLPRPRSRTLQWAVLVGWLFFLAIPAVILSLGAALITGTWYVMVAIPAMVLSLKLLGLAHLMAGNTASAWNCFTSLIPTPDWNDCVRQAEKRRTLNTLKRKIHESH